MSYRITLDVQGPVDVQDCMPALERAIATVLEQMAQPPDTGVSVLLVDDPAIQALNREYRGIDAPTDVLSFSANEGEALVLPPGFSPELGDIVISWPTAARQATRMGHDTLSEVALLVIHGCLHLLGYDHGTADEQTEMWRLQDSVLQSLGYALSSYIAPEDQEADDE